MEFYRRIVEARSLEEVGRVHSELRDRFGAPPVQVQSLLEAAVLRVVGAELGLESLVVDAEIMTGRFGAGSMLGRNAWESLMDRLGKGARFAGEAPLRFEVPLEGLTPLSRIRSARNRLLTREEAEYLGSLMPDETPATTSEDA